MSGHVLFPMFLRHLIKIVLMQITNQVQSGSIKISQTGMQLQGLSVRGYAPLFTFRTALC